MANSKYAPTTREKDVDLVGRLFRNHVEISATAAQLNAVAAGVATVLTVTGDTVLTAADSNTFVEINAAASKTMTLPAANAVAAGVSFIFVLKVASTSGAGHTVHPVGTDLMRGNGFTPAAAKGAVNTQATSRIGDSIRVMSNGSDAWYITALTGAWARES